VTAASKRRVAEMLAAAPPLSAEQRTKLAELLAPAREALRGKAGR
jgi:hypothetical protein